MIKSLAVKGLWGRYDYDLQFNEDVNIFTGSNGTGKTTLLKMLWYVYSGNYVRLMTEVVFDELVVEVDIRVKITVKLKHFSFSRKKYQLEVLDSGGRSVSNEAGSILGLRFIPESIEGMSLIETNELTNSLTSYFFPTFRRIEGSYQLEQNQALADVLRDFTNKMSVSNHRFITSSNSEDIRAIIHEISSNIRVEMEAFDRNFMAYIAKNVNRLSTATEELKKKIEQKEKAEAKAKEPIDNLSRYVDHFFWEKSVAISDNLKLGQHENEIIIENLSAGEKNLLSFLVYATSMKEGIMFIDEPELNLHIEWQRELVATLRDIAPNVQLFMASHSPAIYAGYDDKSPWFNDLIRHTTSNEPALVE